MLETALAIAMFASILGFIGVILKILLSMNTKITRNMIDIQYIKQKIGMIGCSNTNEEEKKEE